jgi:hypothetical protein
MGEVPTSTLLFPSTTSFLLRCFAFVSSSAYQVSMTPRIQTAPVQIPKRLGKRRHAKDAPTRLFVLLVKQGRTLTCRQSLTALETSKI